jgi:hypothetical protein
VCERTRVPLRSSRESFTRMFTRPLLLPATSRDLWQPRMACFQAWQEKDECSRDPLGGFESLLPLEISRVHGTVARRPLKRHHELSDGGSCSARRSIPLSHSLHSRAAIQHELNACSRRSLIEGSEVISLAST